ncbi:MAG: DUF4416 family protein [Phycisphaerae bacterium]
MANVREVLPVKLFVAQLVAPDGQDKIDLIDRALEERFETIDLKSQNWPFEFTDYYTPEMGANLIRRIVSFEKLIDPSFLADAKLITNDIEQDLTRQLRSHGSGRIVNLDAGYLSLGQILLATTKSYSHRIYLSKGIWAEVTLRFHKDKYEKWDWTYPDYADGRYNDFWLMMREKLRNL